MFSILESAGWPIWPLLVCSVIATALIIERLYQLRAQRVIPSSLLVEVLDKVDAGLPSSIDVDQLERGSPLGSILSATLRAFSANPKAQELELKQEIELEGRIIAHQLDR